jgi:DNA mismatch repair protein MutS2
LKSKSDEVKVLPEQEAEIYLTGCGNDNSLCIGLAPPRRRYHRFGKEEVLMETQTFSTLELDSLLQLLVRHIQTPVARDPVLSLQPMTDPAEIERAQEITTECVRFLDTSWRFGFSGIEDPEPLLLQLQIEGTLLEPAQVLSLERLVSAGMGSRELFQPQEMRAQFPTLAGIAARMPDLRGLLSQIHGKILPGGEIDDNASHQLRAIRREIHAARTRIHRSLENILRQQTQAVQEDIITFRNGRFVIPIRTDARNQVPGVVHGLSSSGQTTYIEPMPVIDQNNELVRLHEEEELEVRNILQSITEAFRFRLPGIRMVLECVREFDFGQAKARLSNEFGCVRPRFTRTQGLELTEARHILLENALRSSGGSVVPISFELDDQHPTLVISGPNAGGKTVVLKTVGLLALMAQMGLHVPARQARLPVFSQVFADIGDQQSISANLSTFTAHMRNIADMAGRVVPPSLLLLDEVGTGTDPEEGAALAVSIVNFFRQTGATTLATTHYNPLKMWASQTEGVLNGSVEFDENTLRPTYRLIVGAAGASSGLEIARRMAVPDAILEDARAMMHSDHDLATGYLKKLRTLVDEQTALRTALEDERAATARKYSSLEEEFARREAARRSELEAALARAVREFSLQSEQLIHGLKDRRAAEKMRKSARTRAAQLRRSGTETVRKIEAELRLLTPGPAAAGATAEAAPPPPAFPLSAEPEEGSRVWIVPLSQTGTVESIHDEIYLVAVGSMKFRAHREDLQVLETADSQETARPPVRPAPELTLEQPFTMELNVIGLTADEAVQRVDKFLDESFLAGVQSIRIIHGHGKGILRRAIADLLTGHPQVSRFQPAPPNQGGTGATVVDLQS